MANQCQPPGDQDRGDPGTPAAKTRPGIVSAESIATDLAAAEAAEAAARRAADQAAESSSLPPLSARYPDYLMPFAGRQDRHYEQFDELREQMLTDYGYNTARAYWGDLDDLYLWAFEREKDVLALDDRDVTQYLALLRRRKYSENTIRRKRHTITRFRDLVKELGQD